MAGGLGAISIGPERNGEHRFELLHRQLLLILDFEALGAVRANGHDFRGENGAASGFVEIALALLQQTGIDGLHLGLLVDFGGAAALENHAGDARDVVPDGEIGDERPAGESEDVGSFLNVAAMAAEDLAHGDAGVAVIDVNIDEHFVE